MPEDRIAVFHQNEYGAKSINQWLSSHPDMRLVSLTQVQQGMMYGILAYYEKIGLDAEVFEKTLKLPENTAETANEIVEGVTSFLKDEITKVFDALHPIPDVVGLSENEAITKIKNAGFDVELIKNYPPETPQGIVIDCKRKPDRYMTALLDVEHPLPEVIGLPWEQAEKELRTLGFRPNTIITPRSDIPNQKVININRDGYSMDVDVWVSKSMPSISTGMPVSEAISRFSQSGMNVSAHEEECSDTIPVGHIIRCRIVDENNVVLVVSNGKSTLTCKNAKVNISAMHDGNGGQGTANATYNRSDATIIVGIQFKLDVNHKHTITELKKCRLNNNTATANFSFGYGLVPKVVEPGQAIDIRMTIPYLPKDASEKFPEKLSLSCVTSYGGIVKKSDSFSIDVLFNWD